MKIKEIQAGRFDRSAFYIFLRQSREKREKWRKFTENLPPCRGIFIADGA